MTLLVSILPKFLFFFPSPCINAAFSVITNPLIILRFVFSVNTHLALLIASCVSLKEKEIIFTICLYWRVAVRMNSSNTLRMRSIGGSFGKLIDSTSVGARFRASRRQIIASAVVPFFYRITVYG